MITIMEGPYEWTPRSNSLWFINSNIRQQEWYEDMQRLVADPRIAQLPQGHPRIPDSEEETDRWDVLRWRQRRQLSGRCCEPRPPGKSEGFDDFKQSCHDKGVMLWHVMRCYDICSWTCHICSCKFMWGAMEHDVSRQCNFIRCNVPRSTFWEERSSLVW